MFNWLKNAFSKTARPGSRGFAQKLLAQGWTEAFRLARKDPPRDAYQPYPFSGDAAIASSHDLLHRRVRDLARNNAQAKRIVGALTDLVVGQGFQTFSWPFDPTETAIVEAEIDQLLDGGQLGPRLTFALESDDLFTEWANDEKQIDVEGRLNWTDLQRMAMGECVQVGNGFLVRSMKKDFDLVPLAYQILERDQLDTTFDRPLSDEENKIVGGVELDAHNRVVAYHFFLDHPHDLFFGTSQSMLGGAGQAFGVGQRRARIPADRVIDLALFHRPSASLGISWFDAIGDSTFDRQSYTDSEIRSAALGAAFILVAQLMDKGAGQFAPDLDDLIADNRGRKYQVGNSPMAQVVGPGESIEMVSSDRPNANAPAFLKVIDRDTAGGAGISYYTLTGDYASTNFSSTRAAKMDEDVHISALQQWFGHHVALPVRRDFNRAAAAVGLFKSVTPKEYFRRQRTYQRFDAIGPGRGLLDPRSETEAVVTLLRSGLSTYKEACARRNVHWMRQLIQISAERRIMKRLNVSLDFSKNSTGETEAGAVGDEVERETVEAGGMPNA